jgi:hypothetical protein
MNPTLRPDKLTGVFACFICHGTGEGADNILYPNGVVKPAPCVACEGQGWLFKGNGFEQR